LHHRSRLRLVSARKSSLVDESRTRERGSRCDNEVSLRLNSFMKQYTYAHLLCRYHGEGDPEHEIVELEMQEMNEAITTTGTDKQVSLILYKDTSLNGILRHSSQKTLDFCPVAVIQPLLTFFLSGGTTKISSVPAPPATASSSSCASAFSAS